MFQISPKLWAETPSKEPKETDGPESFYCYYKSSFTKAHPKICVVLSELREIQVETELKVDEISKITNVDLSNSKTSCES